MLLKEASWATARTVSRSRIDRKGREKFDDALVGARNTIRDSIAVLTLYQRGSTRTDTSIQAFGLATDIGSALEHHFVTTPAGQYLSSGSSWHGAVGEWEFTSAQMARFRADPRFGYLDQTLRTAVTERDEWQQRILASLRTWTVANALDRPSIRIVLAATALEALFGDPFRPGARATGGHRIAQRAAYVWCGSELAPPDLHWRGRPACPFLTEPSTKKLDARLAVDRNKGQAWACSWYGDLIELFDHRNAALHGAEQFDERVARKHEYSAERVLIAAIEWTLSSGAKGFAQLDGEIAALPVA